MPVSDNLASGLSSGQQRSGQNYYRAPTRITIGHLKINHLPTLSGRRHPGHNRVEFAGLRR
ncbi:MAG: hypothetical protein GPOALKHO_001920 [Sodalis sp.]|nr:MAG: hypothetical protein GPOALKHO_001920 [Sodalis sp.]